MRRRSSCGASVAASTSSISTRPLVGSDQAVHHFEGGRLARARAAEQDDALAATHRERQATTTTVSPNRLVSSTSRSKRSSAVGRRQAARNRLDGGEEPR